MVALLGQLSKPSAEVRRLLDSALSQVRSTVDVGRPTSTKQKQVRLSDTQRAELVQRHRDGAPKKELARVYGIHVETVRASFVAQNRLDDK